MSRIYITFGGNGYDHITQKAVQDAPRFGCDDIRVYDDAWLSRQEFFSMPENRWIFEHRGPGNEAGGRGFGWFCWKPFIILHALKHFAEPGDVVLYVDGDTFPIADLRVLFDRCTCDGGIMAFRAEGCSNRQWTKRDCLMVMAMDGRPELLDTNHAVARFMLFQRGPWRVRQFLMEWLTYCLNPRATTFDASVYGTEYRGFEQHRTEQAIFSLLTRKYGLRLYREACQYGAKQPQDQDLYPQLFEQDGSRLPFPGKFGSRFANVS